MSRAVARAALCIGLGLVAWAHAAAQVRAFSVGPDLKVGIPDGAYDGSRASMGCSRIAVPAGLTGTLQEVWVGFGVDHTFIGDLTAKLFSPAGTAVTLFSRPGLAETADDGSTPIDDEFGDDSNFSRSFLISIFNASRNDPEVMGLELPDDQAIGNFMIPIHTPDIYFPNPGAAGGGNLGSFQGESPAGEWALCFGDAELGDSGQIDYWQLALKFTGGADTACAPGPEALCLVNAPGAAAGRFRVTARWETATGESGAAQAVPLTADTGYFWFFDSNNVEVIVKVLDACAAFRRYWVFAAGLTDVRVSITVEDTETGVKVEYENPKGEAFVPIQDTAAFTTCPVS